MCRYQARAICRAPTLRCHCKTILSWILDATACCDTAGERRQHSVSGGALAEDFVRRGLGANHFKRGSFLANEPYGAATIVIRACFNSLTAISVSARCGNPHRITLSVSGSARSDLEPEMRCSPPQSSEESQ